jgi:hypothetical protein
LETYRGLIFMMSLPYDEESRARKQNRRAKIAWGQFGNSPRHLEFAHPNPSANWLITPPLGRVGSFPLVSNPGKIENSAG